ncbi:MAG: class I SAM-dependent methyltransferase [Bacillota bacterium]|nr:class I SAM-dependent methyltransferase [Bacillota bacterium]
MENQQSYWNGRYSAEKHIWGMEPCMAAKRSAEVFKSCGFHNILVPGCGYGRHSLFLAQNGLKVTGFDISDQAVEIAKAELPKDISINYSQGNALDEEKYLQEYDGILSINMLHLFPKDQRQTILQNFSKALKKGGRLVLTSMSVNDADYGKGERSVKYTFEAKKGRPIHYFNEESMKELISDYFKVVSIEEIREFENHGGKEHYHNMIFVVAEKV